MHHLAYLAVSGPEKNSNPAFTAVMVLTAIPFRTPLRRVYNELALHNRWKMKGLTASPEQVTAHGGEEQMKNHYVHRSFSVQGKHIQLHRALDQTRQPVSTRKNKTRKRGDKTCISGSEMRVDEINPARITVGEHPGRRASMRSWHGTRLKLPQKTSSLPAQVDIWSGFPSSSRHAEPSGSGEQIRF